MFHSSKAGSIIMFLGRLMDKHLMVITVCVLLSAFFQQACVVNKQLLLDQAKREYNENNVGSAIKHFKKVIRIDNRDADAHYYLGRIYLDTNRLGEAANHFSAALKLKPSMASAYTGLGLVSLLRNDLKGAQTFLRNAILMDPRDITALNNLGFLFLKKKEYAKAIDYYSQAYRIDSMNSVANYNLGEIYRKVLKDNRKAILHYQKYLKSNKKETAVALEIRAWLQKIGEKEEVNLNDAPPQSKSSTTVEGFSEHSREEAKPAIESSVRTEEKEKKNHDVHTAATKQKMKAQYYVQLGEESLKRALSSLLSPDITTQREADPKFHHQLAVVYLRLGYLKKALKELRIAKKLGSESEEVMLLLEQLRCIEN